MADRGPRTSLRLSVEAQTFFKLLAISGAAAHQTATLLVQYNYDITRVALHLGLAERCKKCSNGKDGEGCRGCRRHLCMVRQRVKRAVDRMMTLVPALHVPLRRRPAVHYGADRSADQGTTLYDRTSAPDDSGRSDTADPAELAERAEEEVLVEEKAPPTVRCASPS